MRETDWADSITLKIQKELDNISGFLKAESAKKLPYAYEIVKYREGKKAETINTMSYETDILIYEENDKKEWVPRIIIECKINSITTHDAITYSQKSKTHKNIHPYLRYGILIGNRKDYPLPGRLFRHGENFDFMMSFRSFTSGEREWQNFIEIIQKEIKASKFLEEILFNSRSKYRKKFTVLHRPLVLK